LFCDVPYPQRHPRSLSTVMFWPCFWPV
jgi:hypothetical protein